MKIFKKFITAIITVAITIAFFGCSSAKDQPEIKESTVDFDLLTATEMIQDWDEKMAWLSTQTALIQEDADQFKKTMESIFPSEGQNALEMLFDGENLTIDSNVFYPTMFHADIEVVSAKENIIEEYQQDGKLIGVISNQLTIREEYSGDDSDLNGWYREYVFTRSDCKSWVFQSFAGIGTLYGNSFSPSYLPLREDSKTREDKGTVNVYPLQE